MIQDREVDWRDWLLNFVPGKHSLGYVPDNGCSAKPLARSALSDCFIRHSYFLRLEITYKHEIGNKNVLLKKSP